MSAQKQCPKCGEKNPAEAVMCWACYTSLTGGAAVMAAGSGGPAGGLRPGAMSDSGDKKKVDPKQLAVIGVGLLIAVGYGVSKVMGGGGDSEEITATIGTKKTSPMTKATDPPPMIQPGPGPSIGLNGTPAEVPKSSQPPVPFPYNMIAPPNPKGTWAVMGIVATQNDVTEGQAKGLAVFAHRQLDKIKKFPTTEIYVFNDVQAAQTFASFQNMRRGEKLSASDYQSAQLAPVWNKALVRYLSFNNRIFFSSPQRNPSGFWASAATG